MTDRCLSSMLFLVSHAMLTGSRGRARQQRLPEPTESDFDWIIFTDEPAEIEEYRRHAGDCVLYGPFIIKERPDGFTLHHGRIDISVYPRAKQFVMQMAWALIYAGKSKDDAWKIAYEFFKYPQPKEANAQRQQCT